MKPDRDGEEDANPPTTSASDAVLTDGVLDLVLSGSGAERRACRLVGLQPKTYRFACGTGA